MQGKPRPTLPLLGIGKNQQWWLCHQTPCTYSSSGNATNFPNPHRNSTRTTLTSHKSAVRIFLEERFSIGHGPTPLAYVPTYVRTFHSTPQQSGVEQILSSTPKMVPLHSRTYLQTNVRYTLLAYVPTYEHTFPLHSTSQSGVEQKKSMNSYKKPDDEKITRRWKSQMLKILPDAEKARRWKNCQTLKKHQIYSP